MLLVHGHCLCHLYMVIVYVTCTWPLFMSLVHGHVLCHVYMVIVYITYTWSLVMSLVHGHFYVTCTWSLFMSLVHGHSLCHLYVVILILVLAVSSTWQGCINWLVCIYCGCNVIILRGLTELLRTLRQADLSMLAQSVVTARVFVLSGFFYVPIWDLTDITIYNACRDRVLNRGGRHARRMYRPLDVPATTLSAPL